MIKLGNGSSLGWANSNMKAINADKNRVDLVFVSTGSALYVRHGRIDQESSKTPFGLPVL
jgi:hypothetical protein